MSRLNDLDAWKVFCEIVSAGGINAACDKFGVESSTVSRTLKALETEIGSPLFSRGSRPAALTELGRRAYAKVAPILSAQDAFVAELKGDRDRLAGVIRVASHAGIGPNEIIPKLVEFQMTYPEIQLELYELSAPIPAGFTSPEGEAIDVIVGYGPEKIPANVVRRHCGVMPFIACASSLYVRRHGMPLEPKDLRLHTGILVNSPTRNSTTSLRRGDREEKLHWKQRMVVHNLMSAQRAAAMGGGIVPDLPLYHCALLLKSKLLIQVLPGWQREPLDCYVFASEEAWERRRVQVFVEWMAERERETLNELREKHSEFY